jgi:tape measure domain-containing protein
MSTTNIDDLKVTLSLDGANFMITASQAGRVVRNLQSQIEGLGGGVARIEQHLNSAAAGFRRFVITLGALRFIMMDIQDVFLSLPSAILKTSGEVERMTKLMEGLSKAGTEAGRRLEALQNTQFVFNLAQNAPFEVKAIQDAFVKLKTAGLDPTKGSLQALLDSVAKFGGSSEQLKRASIAIQQMGGKGVVSMEELRQQLGEAVPDAIQMMATGMKMGMGELVKAISKGTVEAQSAMGKMFAVMTLMNQGAAAKMMDTWVGILAQMNTRWELFKNAVGQAGFAEAAKDAARQINELLGSPEGRRFALELGQGLASAVNGLVSLARWITENTTLLKIFAGVLVSTFATTRIVDFVRRSGESLKGLWLTEQVLMQRRIQEKQGIIAAELINETNAARAKTALLQKEVADNAAQQATLIRQRQAYLAELLVLESTFRNNAAGQTIYTKGSGRSGYASETSIRLNERMIEQKKRELEMNERQLGQAAVIATTTKAQIANTEALAKSKEALTGKALSASLAISALTKAKAAAGAVFSLMGGWIGAVSLALTFGIPLWMKYANSAEDALKRIRNAVNSGSADEETLKSINSELTDARAKLARLKSATPDKNLSQKVQEQQRLANADEITRLNRKILDLETQQAEAAEQVRERNAVIASESWRKAADKEVAAIQSAGETRANEMLEEAQRQKLTGQKLDDVKQKAVQERLKAEIAAGDRLNEIAQAARVRRDNAQGDEDRRAANTEFNRASKAAQEQAERISAVQKNLAASNVFVDSKKDKKDKSETSSFENFLDSQRRSAAELRLKISKWEDDALTEADLFDAAVRKVQDLRKAGLLKAKNADGKEREMTDVEQTAAVQEAFINEKLRVAENGIRRMRDIYNTAQAASLTNLERRGQDPALIGLTSGSNAADVLINRLSSQMQVVDAILRESGQNWEDWVDRIKAATESSDLSRWLEGSNKTISEINASLKEAGSGSKFENEREKAAKRISDAQKQADKLIEIETNRRKRNYEDEEQAAQNIVAIQQSLADQILAINNKLAYDTRGPIERMAEEWQNMSERMETAGAGWIAGFIDTFVDGLEQGKFAFKDFATSILKEITKLMMQKMVAQFVMSLMGGGSITGIDPSTGAGILAGGGQVFAKGGIMTSQGRMPLNSYAKGGVASQPQVAVFGEGRMNEAYVPLPDGKRIPVALEGSDKEEKTNVQVNVFNQTGQQTEATANTRFDGKQMVLDIVLRAANSPGQFRDGMKQALR